MSTSGIYAIVNTVTGKPYVGSSYQIDIRLKTHLHSLRRGVHHNIKLQRSFNKHGEAAFFFQTLEYAAKGELIDREQFWIDFLDASRNGYNIHSTAHSRKPEHNRKISEGLKGHRHTEESKLKMSRTRQGRRHTEESRRKISDTLKGHIVTEDVAHKISNGNKGRIVSEETRRKISEARKGQRISEDTKRKMSEAHKANPHRIIFTEETRRKISEAKKGHPVSEETRRKISEARKKRSDRQ